MKRTIRWPPQVIGGRLAMTADPASDPIDQNEALRQIIRLSLLDGTNSNPWNDVGLDDPTFTTMNATSRARIRSAIRDVFDQLERTHRAKLSSVVFKDDTDADAPALKAVIAYINLETGGRERMEVTRQ